MFKVEPVIPIYSHDFGFFTLDITAPVIIQWIIILIVGIVSFLLTRNLKKKPDKKQAALEKLYVTVESVVKSTMGENYANFVGKYLVGYMHPFAFMAPINVMERVMLPVSLALRLFGNMLAATILVDLVYEALGKFAIGLPIIVHGYFDLFDGTIQMLVFSMLTMIQIKLTAEH